MVIDATIIVHGSTDDPNDTTIKVHLEPDQLITQEVLKSDQCDIAFLHTREKLFNLYKSVGFEPLKGKYKAIGLSGKVYLGEGGMLTPVNSNEVFAEIIKAAGIIDLQRLDW